MKTATIELRETHVVTVGEVGPRGQPGISADAPKTSALNLDTVHLRKCQPVVMRTDGNIIRANALTEGRVFGFVFDDVIPMGNFGLVQTDGQFDASLTEWSYALGHMTGLAPGARYFLSPTTGLITPTPDLTAIVAFVGRAASTTRFVIDIDPPVYP